MGHKNKNRVKRIFSLNTSENIEVEKKVNFELSNFRRKVVNIGGMLNPIAGIFIILTLHDKANYLFLLGWYIVLVVINATNVFISYKDRNITPDQAASWRKACASYHIMIGLLCLTWGSIALLHFPHDAHYQLFIITFLELCIVGFSFGNMGDFSAAVVSNICLLAPYVGSSIYYKIFDKFDGYDPALFISYNVTLLILSVFSLMVTYVGYKLIKNFFRLGFENVVLSDNLENANKFLEHRVKERTHELEDSLKVVTYQATHDLLTDLPNQRLLFNYLETAIELASRNEHMFAVCFFFLNEMEKINDGLGHQASEFIIKTVAQRFKRKIETLKKIKGINYTITLSRKDVFVILIDPVYEMREIEIYIKPLFSILKKAVYYENHAIKLTASMGISVYPRDGRDISTLLMNAGAAMMHAKKQGGNWFNIYTSADNANLTYQLEMESSLHTALMNNEIRVQYQPIIDVKTRKIVGIEALTRWQQPMLGLISPDDFIPIAEANGIIIPLGEWVFQNACLQTKKWHDQGYPIKVAVNLSSKQLQKKYIVETFSEILEQVGLGTQFVELELTETVAYQKEVIPILKHFKALGFCLVIDDFGTGYSGLSNLKLFDIDKIKLDKSFIRDIDVNEDSQAIVSNTIALAKKMGVLVLAEGVETKVQLEFLEKHGCDLIQGFYFSPPINADALSALLKRLTFESDSKIT